MSSSTPTSTGIPYLAPYLRAVAVHGAEFRSLLWASPQTQQARFAALCRLADPRGRSVLDVGCGRADLLDFLIAHEMPPADYVGIEAVAELATAAGAKTHDPGTSDLVGYHRGCRATIVRADFVEQPAAMFVGAEVVYISGALNTLTSEQFYTTIRRAYDAMADMLAFNFLCSPAIAAADYLRWYDKDEVIAFARTLSPLIDVATNYLFGDATIAIRKPG